MYDDIYVGKGATVKKVHIINYDSQYVLSGGTAIQTDLSGQYYSKDSSSTQRFYIYNGIQNVNGGVVKETLCTNGGRQTVDSGGKAYKTFVKDGTQTIFNGTAFDTKLSKQSQQYIYKGGVASNTLIDCEIFPEMRLNGQHIGYAAYGQFVGEGAKVYNTKVMQGLQQVQNGTAYNTILAGSSVQAVLFKGTAYNTTINKGGYQEVVAGGRVYNSIVNKGGTLEVGEDGIVGSVTVNGGTLIFDSGAVLQGNNTFSGGTITGGSNKTRISLAKKGSLTLTANTVMKKFYLTANNATLTLSGTGNTLGSLLTDKSTTIRYDISKLAAKSTAFMLTLSTQNTQKLGSFVVNAKKNQGVGVYELSKNIVQKNTLYTITLAGKKQGAATLNGLGLIKGNTIYAVNTKSNAVSLTVATAGTTILNGHAKKATLKGSAKWDVFYGGKGNDTIIGNGGRDVAVYDKKNVWGKDAIAKTNGTMTILFNGLTSKEIKTSLKKGVMTITRASDAKQAITVQGWNAATHSIVFAKGTMTKFNKYLKKATTTQITAARNEAFKQAGLASA